MEEKKTDSLGGKKFIPPIRPPLPRRSESVGGPVPPSPPKPPPPPPAPKPVLSFERDVPITIPTAPPPAPKSAPPAPKPVLAAPLPVPTAGENDIVIQTMQDDMDRMGIVPRASAPTVQKNAPPESAAAPQAFPLPPKNIQKKQKIVMSPMASRGRVKRWLKRAAVGVSILLLIGSGAGAWYVFSHRSSTPQPQNASTPADLLPASADAIAAYSFQSDAARSEITALWARNGTPSVSTLLQGDPRFALTDTAVTQLFYVILPNDPRPYLLIPQTKGIEQLLNGTPDAAVTTQNGWFIAHQLDPTPYTTALKNGSLQSSPNAALLKQVSETSPMSVLVRSGPLQGFRSAFGGKNGANGSLQALALAVHASNTQKALSFSGFGQTSAALTEGAPAAQKLLETVPQDSTAVYLGGNFSQDLGTWQESASPLPPEILAQPAVSQLLQKLTVPYVWYARTGADTIQDVGLVLDISGVATPPVLGETGIEQALSGLIPLVMEQKLTTPVAFKDGAYAGTPLRFVNILGSTLSLDYAVANGRIAIASSKEGMLALLDTSSQRSPSVVNASTWQALFTEWGAIPTDARHIVFGSFQQPLLKKLLPKTSAAASDGTLITGATSTVGSSGIEIKGFVLNNP